VESMSQSLPLRSRLAASAVVLTNRLVRWSRRGDGTVAGGRVGLRIAPRLLGDLANGRTVVCVSGTNGKTTTTAMTAKGWGVPVASNQTGANMPAGLVAAMAGDPTNAAVLEVDEAWLGRVVRDVRPAVVSLLNLSRDQMDRASEVRQLALKWRDVVRDNPDVHFVANAGDPLVAFAARDAAHVTWIATPWSWRGDAISCPRCTHPLHFGVTWHCASCGFSQPPSDMTVGDDGEIRRGGVRYEVPSSLPGLFNRVNAAFALAALDVVGVAPGPAGAKLGELESIRGRYGLRTWHGRTIRLLLAKNPAGVASLLASRDDLDEEVWVAINAEIADGRDPSWLYDAPFEQLRGRTVKCLGRRRLDIATRLLYAGVACNVVDDESTLHGEGGPVTVIANYTTFRRFFETSTSC